jgi:protein SCO1/2
MLVLLFVLVVRAHANQQKTPPVGIVEKLGQTIPLDVEFYDESGQLVSIKDFINKPTIFTFVYYRCPGICSPLLTELSRIVEKMDLKLGKDYQILTVGFDHREKPELAAGKRENYLSSINRPVDPNGWRFFTGDSVNIQRITDGAGFYFMRSGNDYVHAGALIIVSPEGKITRYINGIQYLPFDVKMALIEASNGKVTPTIAKVLQFCYSYDPEARTYTFNVVRVSGVVIVGLVGIFVLVFIVRPKKKQTEG